METVVAYCDIYEWHRRYLDLAATVGSWSKDPSTKMGAVIVRPDRTVASLGYNGFPRGMDDDPLYYNNRVKKMDMVIHSEMNALLTCRDPFPLTDYTLFTPGPCCSRCAVHMIQAGIREYVYTDEHESRWPAWGIDRAFGYMDMVGAKRIRYTL